MINIIDWLITHFFDLLSFFITLFKKEDSKEERRVYKELMRKSKSAYDIILHETVFFGDVLLRRNDGIIKNFVKEIDIRERNSDKRVKIKRLQKQKESFILTGVAGIGKSCVLKYLFLKEYVKKIFSKKKLCLYLSSEKILNFFSNDSFIEDLSVVNINELRLYLDGIDEVIDEENITFLARNLDSIKHKVDNVLFFITCRLESLCLIKEELRKHFPLNCFVINVWEDAPLIVLSNTLIKTLTISKDMKQNLQNFVVRYMHLCEQNPLLLKMLLWAKLQNSSYSPNQNRFVFYSEFFDIIIHSYYKSHSGQRVSRVRKSEYASIVYNTYIADVRNRFVKNMVGIEKILKKSEQHGLYIFTHETFFEFLFAWHVCEKIMKSPMECIDVMSYEFPNGFSDFISFGLKRNIEEERKKIVNNLINIYKLTLDSNARKIFRRDQILSMINDYDRKTNSALKNVLKDKDDKSFFILKYEIVFRIGRLGVYNDTIIAFLKFVYFNDANISFHKTCIDKMEREKLLIALKRCCAISASFVGAEDIEIDYVSHMLPYKSDKYHELYDKINRMHTLIYYGDLIMKNNGILDMITYLEDENCPCNNSCNKRVNRLAKLNDYMDDICCMSVSDKRIYYFRLFDIATIYTFVCSRNSKEQLAWLDEHSQNIIRSFKTDFIGISQERKSLLDEIKNRTIERIDELNNNIL